MARHVLTEERRHELSVLANTHFGATFVTITASDLRKLLSAADAVSRLESSQAAATAKINSLERSVKSALRILRSA